MMEIKTLSSREEIYKKNILPLIMIDLSKSNLQCPNRIDFKLRIIKNPNDVNSLIYFYSLLDQIVVFDKKMLKQFSSLSGNELKFNYYTVLLNLYLVVLDKQLQMSNHSPFEMLIPFRDILIIFLEKIIYVGSKRLNLLKYKNGSNNVNWPCTDTANELYDEIYTYISNTTEKIKYDRFHLPQVPDGIIQNNFFTKLEYSPHIRFLKATCRFILFMNIKEDPLSYQLIVGKPPFKDVYKVLKIVSDTFISLYQVIPQVVQDHIDSELANLSWDDFQ